MQRNVIVGDDFTSIEVAEEMKQRAELFSASTAHNESRTRTILAYGICAIAAAFAICAAAIGFHDGSYDELQSVWNVVGPMLGAVLVYYFGASGKKNHDQNPS